jgi:hypothetical protein
VSEDRIYLEGELYLSVETVAEIYRVEEIWLREVFDAGLLTGGVHTHPRLCIAAVRLDHVATIVRLHRVLGFDVEAIRLALERSSDAIL